MLLSYNTKKQRKNRSEIASLLMTSSVFECSSTRPGGNTHKGSAPSSQVAHHSSSIRCVRVSSREFLPALRAIFCFGRTPQRGLSNQIQNRMVTTRSKTKAAAKPHYEFGGPIGALGIIFGLPAVCYGLVLFCNANGCIR